MDSNLFFKKSESLDFYVDVSDGKMLTQNFYKIFLYPRYTSAG